MPHYANLSLYRMLYLAGGNWPFLISFNACNLSILLILQLIRDIHFFMDCAEFNWVLGKHLIEAVTVKNGRKTDKGNVAGQSVLYAHLALIKELSF